MSTSIWSRGYQEDGARLFSAVPSNRTSSNRQKLFHQFHLIVRKNFFILWVTKDWNRLPRVAVGSLLLEVIKGCLDTFLSNVLWRTLLEQGDGSRQSPVVPSNLSHSVIWWFHDLDWEPKQGHLWKYLVHPPAQSRANFQFLSYLSWAHIIKI